MPTDTGIVPVNYRASMGANFYWTKTHGAYKRHLVQKIERVLSNRFTIALLGRVELWYTSCADSGNITFLPLNLPSSDGVRLG